MFLPPVFNFMIIDDKHALRREFEEMFKEVKMMDSPSHFIMSAADKETILRNLIGLYDLANHNGGFHYIYDTAERSFGKTRLI